MFLRSCRGQYLGRAVSPGEKSKGWFTDFKEFCGVKMSDGFNHIIPP